MGLAPIVEKQVTAHRVRPFGLAFVDGGESYWHRRTDGEDRMAMLMREFLPMVAERFALSGPRGILGWSMGGYGALLAAEEHPDVFDAIAAASPAIWPSYEAMMNGPGDAFDSPTDFAAHDVFSGITNLAHTDVRIDCGEQDPFYWYVREFVDAFPADRRPQGQFTPGGHNAEYWKMLLPAQVAFFGDALA